MKTTIFFSLALLALVRQSFTYPSWELPAARGKIQLRFYPQSTIDKNDCFTAICSNHEVSNFYFTDMVYDMDPCLFASSVVAASGNSKGNLTHSFQLKKTCSNYLKIEQK
jgi:hypothetical protein